MTTNEVARKTDLKLGDRRLLARLDNLEVEISQIYLGGMDNTWQVVVKNPATGHDVLRAEETELLRYSTPTAPPPRKKRATTVTLKIDRKTKTAKIAPPKRSFSLGVAPAPPKNPTTAPTLCATCGRDHEREFESAKRDDRYNPAHPRHRELLLAPCSARNARFGLTLNAPVPPENGAPFYVHCRISGGVTGTREGLLKKDGKVATFSPRAAAETEADRLNREMNNVYSVASFSYRAISADEAGVWL